MLLFIGGAHAGKRNVVGQRFPSACWHRVEAGIPLGAWRARASAGVPLVLTGWPGWLEASLPDEPDDDRLRGTLAAELDALCVAERERGLQAVLILPEMGRGIVPMSPERRRLRDLAGWLAQDAAARADATWYVRHGLAMRLA